jgi:hypothetical protein
VSTRWNKTLALPAAMLASAFAFAGSEACGSSGDVEVRSDAASEVSVGDAGDAGETATPFTEEAMRSAAQAFNAKYCDAFSRWDPVYFRYTFGDMATCMAAGGLVAIAADEARVDPDPDPGAPYAQRRFLDDVRAPYAHGSLLTPDKLVACAAALEIHSLRDWVRFFREHVVPAACVDAFRGELGNDEPCGAWNQCASGLCLQGSNVPPGSCGRCVRRGAVDDRCPVDACLPGLTCRGATASTMICTRYADVDEPCTANAPGRPTSSSTLRPCHDELLCVNGRCAVPPANDACQPGVGCSFVPFLRYCGADKRCTDMPLAKRGQPCGPDPGAPGGVVPCEHGSTCTQVEDPRDAGSDAGSPPGTYYECVLLLEDGEACVGSVDHDSPCKSPDSRCFHDVCQRNGPAECTAPAVLP